MPTGETKELPTREGATDCHTAAWKIASRYHLPVMPILKKVREFYPKEEMPDSHLYGLFQQVESQQTNYEMVEGKITEAMALIKVQDENGEYLFEKDEAGVYVHHLRLLKRSLEQMEDGDLLAESGKYNDNYNLSFHYDPYNFDSMPERSFFRQILSILNTDPNDVETFLFTGGLTDSKKTDFHFEYLGEDQRYHRYFPDFVLVKKTGEFYIVEVKSERERGEKTVEAKRKAVERLQGMRQNKFKYHVLYTSTPKVGISELKSVTNWIKNRENETA